VKRASRLQCKACPFRSTSVPRWLGAYRPDEVVNAAWHGAPFYCHCRTDYRDPEWLERADRDGQLCRGFLIFRERMLAPESTDAEIRAAQRQVVAEADAEPTAVDVMPGQAFVAHHTMAPDEAAEFMRKALEEGRSFRI
jgi:hypothetical protein